MSTPTPVGHARAYAVVVNDDPTELNVLSGLVRKAGLDPRTFSDAEAALADLSAGAALTNDAPDGLPALIVTDLYMPGIDGWRFCRLLRSPDYARLNAIPLLVVSATYAGEEPGRIAADLGADAFLSSPVDGQQFIDQVSAIRRREQLRVPSRVLVVEDSVAVARALADAFAAHGYQADTAPTSQAAVEAFRAAAYHVAVLDYHLPDGTGDVLLDTFRAEQPDCVCLMMTTDPGPALALDWMKRGAAAYLHKPFEPDYLIELCSRARRERALLRAQNLLEVRTRELRESEEKYRILLEESSDPVFSFAPDGQYTYANSAFARGVGKPLTDIIGKRIWDVFPKDEADKRFASLSQVFRTGVGTVIEVRVPREDGDRYYMTSITPIRDADGTVTSAICSSRDITERHRAEDERERLQAQLNQAQKMESVGRLAGGVAHDFNNMLGVILGHTELALEQVDPSLPLHADLEEIRSAATRSADLTRHLLAFARKQTVAPKVLDLNDTIAGMLKMLGRLIGEDIRLAWVPDAHVWPVNVDPSQIDQILANLCVNARDAIAGVGTVTIRTGNVSVGADASAARPGLQAGDYVQLAVSDTGCGMSPETLAHIFEPFFTTKSIGKGTGLGLAMVYGAVKQNHGFVEVASEPGRGTTFTLFLPRFKARGVDGQPDGGPEPAVRGHETILLVEDEPAILTLTTKMLERQGYAVLAARSPGEAVRLARAYTGEIHLLMTDVIMPEMNGRDLATSLVSLYPRIGRLFMSGYTADVIAHHGVLEDGVQFIQKPFSMSDLASRVRQALAR